ncbi:Cof-type HAD-IIB family hydrolase [[Mycoplasma] cavipharyngis]|uniref:Cof-type HAD-IIB family hydrolase n=1 Tax=[Mycoplasma] cavipharyngis TaxID=92757 RepID=UPI0037047AB5
METKIKYIYFDLDGTILDRNKTLRFNLVEKIFKIRNQYNIKFGIATGRHYLMVKYVAAKILPELPTITNNGASISYSDFKHIDIAKIAPTDVSKLTSYLQSLQCDFFIFSSQRLYSNNLKNWRIKQLNEAAVKNNLGTLMWKYFPLDQELISRDGVLKFLVCTAEKNPIVKNYVKKNLPNLECLTSESDILDIFCKSVDKYFSIQYVIEKLDADMDEVLYFGDSENDYMCLKEIKNSVYVGRTSCELASVATYITDPADQDGVLKFLNEHFPDR